MNNSVKSLMTVRGVVLRAVLKIGGAVLGALIGCITIHAVPPILYLVPISTGVSTWIAFLDDSVSRAKADGTLDKTADKVVNSPQRP